nr:SNG1 family protein [Candidatus Mycosynbacter amalyticus]
MLAFSYITAFHHPKAHSLPLAVVGEASKVDTVAKTLQDKSNGAYSVSVVSSKDEAVSKLKRQDIYAIYTPTFPTSTITVASAINKSLTTSLETSLRQFDEQYQQAVRKQLAANPQTAALAQAPIKSTTVDDIAALPAEDPNGIGLFYVAFAFVFGGYFAAVSLNLIRGKRIYTHVNAIIRTIGMAVFAFVTSLGVAGIAQSAHILPDGNFWTVVGVGTLTTYGVGMFSGALITLLGMAGTALVIILFVVLGTPASGGPVAVALTGDGIWKSLAGVLPTGSGLSALRQAIYFNGIDIMRYLLVPIVYSLIGVAVLLGYGIRNSSISFAEKEIVNDNKED